MSRYGISIEGATTKTERANVVVAEISRLFGGQATAEADTYAGSLEQMKNEMGDVQEKIGTVLIPVLSSIVSVLKNVANAFNSLNPVVQSTSVVAGMAGAAVLVLTKIVMAFGVTLSAAIWPVTAVVAALAGVAAVVKYWDWIKKQDMTNKMKNMRDKAFFVLTFW